ncbi:transcriptional regulator with aminotransferase type sensor, AraC family [Actinobacteria bacterium OV450]|nr:transcriptional regulator with aminotransferase type sensor, AraC family [Actinobacteria bacterium OV450]
MSVIAVLALDGVPGPHLTTPAMVFGAASRQHPGVEYEVRLCAAPGLRMVRAPDPLPVSLPWGLDGLEDADVVLIAGHAGYRDVPPASVRAALHTAAGRGARIAAVGNGVFTLAATGMLDGRRATTGWRYTEDLAMRHPSIHVDPLGTVVEDGSFLTAAGVFGGLDVCLRVLHRDHGATVAGETARQLITPLQLDADEVQNTIEREILDGSGLEPTLRWLKTRLDQAVTLTEMAAHARTSTSSLPRRFRTHTGRTPLQYLLHARVSEARRLLTETDLPVEQIAIRTGFTSPAVLRRHFRTLTGTTPRGYRQALRAEPAPEAQG